MNWNIKQLKKPVKYAIAAAFVVGFFTHHFGLVNVMHNIDDIGQLPSGYGTGLMSGRWLLTVLGDFLEAVGGNYNLPYLNGLLYLALLACTAGLIVSLFDLKEPVFAALTGGMVAVFPAATAALFFRFTSVYYGLSFFLAVLAAWVFGKHKFGFLASALCICCSLGLYQGYVPVTISLFVLLLLRRALQGDAQLWQLVRRGVAYCLTLVLGLLLYYGLLNLCLSTYGVSLSDYNGMNQMGKLALKDLPSLVYEAIYLFCMMPLKDYCGLADQPALKIGYLLLALLTAVMLLVVLVKKVKKPLIIAFAVLMCAVLPVAVNFVIIMSPDAWIYTLMLYAFALIPCVPCLVWECLPETTGVMKKGKDILGKTLAAVLALMIFCYGYSANINYTAVYFSNRQVENYVNSLVTQIRMAEGFDTHKKWAFLGEPEDPLLRSVWDYEMSYGGAFDTDRTLEAYSMAGWMWNYIGYLPPSADVQEKAELTQLAQVREMPCWPDRGSICVVDDFVVIKFQEVS